VTGWQHGTMSPQSRGREKKRKPHGRKKAQRELSPFAWIVREFAPIAARGQVVEIEHFVSGALGAMSDPLPLPVEDGLVDVLVEHLERQRTTAAVGLLRSVAALAMAAEQRDAAARSADALAHTVGSEPEWTALLGEITCVGACQLTDIWGDQTSLLCTFECAGERHGLLVMVDFNHLGGWVKDFGLTDDPSAARAEMRRAQLESGGVARFEELAPERARRLIEAGIGSTDMTMDPDVGEDYVDLRALALARCRVMPAPELEPPVPEFSDAERDRVVEEFLHAGVAGVSASDAARYSARLLVDYGCDYDAGQPLRVSPGKLETFLLGYLPRRVILDEADRAALPGVVRAWVGWAGAQAQLPPAAVAALDEATEAILGEFDDAYDDVANASPIRALLEDVDDDAGPDDVQKILDRRTFAMPYFGTRIGDEDFPHLDPSDEDERRLLIVGEHPELHEALDDPDFDADAEGFNPHLHITIDQIVINQLWHDDPPEVWHAAQRLQASGMDRLDVIHAIGRALTEQIWHTMHDAMQFDPAAYAAALDQIGASRPRGTRRAKRPDRATPSPREVPHGVFQLKVTLKGARPPIWRRLRLPASATLDELHQVIQAAFGWEDAHLHAFDANGERYAPDDFGLDDSQDSAGVPLSSLLDGVGAKLSYEYDFGDSWRHEIVVESMLEPDGVTHAVCTAGRRAGPVEDCGGIGGWAAICHALDEPNTPEYERVFDWLGFEPDPDYFDKDVINGVLAEIPLSG
jgi:hypothetical protein